MRKRVITQLPRAASASSHAWLDVESAAVVEVTSEDGAYPIDSALAITRETWLVSGEAGISDDPGLSASAKDLFLMLHDVRRCDQHHVQSREQIRPCQREVLLIASPARATIQGNCRS